MGVAVGSKNAQEGVWGRVVPAPRYRAFDGFASMVLTLGCSTRWWCGKSEHARCECLADRDAVATGCSGEGELWQEERKRYISLTCWWLPDSKQTQHSLIQQQRHVTNEYTPTIPSPPLTQSFRISPTLPHPPHHRPQAQNHPTSATPSPQPTQTSSPPPSPVPRPQSRTTCSHTNPSHKASAPPLPPVTAPHMPRRARHPRARRPRAQEAVPSA